MRSLQHIFGGSHRPSPLTSGTRRAQTLAKALAGVAVFLGVVVFTPSARADAAFTLSGSAQGLSLVVHNAGFPLVQSYQVNAPSASATLNSRGQATAYSSVPDPGQSLAEFPSVISGQICVMAPIPGCPSVVAAVPSYPSAYAQSGGPPKDVSLAGAHMHADASSRAANAVTTLGVSGATEARSTARTVSNDDGSQDVSADDDIDALDIAGSLGLSGVRASASIHRDASGTLVPSSTFEVSSLKVAGQTFAIKDGSIDLLGTLVPVPVPVQTLLDALKAIGVTATYLPEQKTANGITSAGLQISYQVPGPPSGIVPPLPPLPLPIGVGVPTTPTDVTYVIGRVTANGTYKAIPGSDDGLTGGTLTGGASTPATAAPSIAPLTASPGGTDQGLSTPSLGGDLPSSGIGGGTTDGGVAPVLAPSAPAQQSNGVAGAGLRKPLTVDAVNIYLVLAFAALAAFAAATAIRFLGVRRTWI